MEMLSCLRDLDTEQQVRLTHNFYRIAQQAYPDCAEQDLGTIDYWLKLRGCDFCFAASVDGEPVAYLDFLVLSPHGEEAFLTGEFSDGELANGQLMMAPPAPSELTFYGSSVVVVPQHQRAGLARRLLGFARNYFQERGYTIRRVYAITWSKGGEAIVRGLGGKLCFIDSQWHRRFVIAPSNKMLPFLP